MKLPSKNIGDWANDLVEQCSVSRQQRAADCAYWRNYYYNGSDQDEDPALYNRCFGHIDRLASFLFSPADVRFIIEFDSTIGKSYLERAQVASRYLSREFHRCDMDLQFGAANELALIKGCAILKTNWGHDGFDPNIVHPESFGVLREDISSLDKQEAFVHSTFLTPSQMRRQLADHPKKDELLEKIKRMAKKKQRLEYDTSFLHEMVVGGIHPLSTTQEAGAGSSSVTANTMPSVTIDPNVAESLICLHELWVLDDDREDWTTIQLVDPEIVIAGQYKRENLCGIKGEHPFHKICPNEIDGYFWGRSELAAVKTLQDLLNRRMDEYDRLAGLQASRCRAYIGFNGITDEINSGMNTQGGYITESQSPGAKIDDFTPKMPPDIFQGINEIINMFDDVAGFENIMQGKGESGVRAGVHADTLMRSAGNRLRDRALLVERQCGGVGDFCFKLLQAKVADVFKTQSNPDEDAPTFSKWVKAFLAMAGREQDTAQEFLLSQFPDDYRVNVDSHSASPAFSMDARLLAEQLSKLGAIDAIGLLELTQPPQADILIARAKEKEAAQAALLQAHPELAGKGRKKK